MMYNTGGWGHHYYGSYGLGLGAPGWLAALFAIAAPFILLIVLWSIFWKGLALWHSARRGQPWWFVILLFVNTLGILEIVYLSAVAKLKINELFTNVVHHNH
jgi:hypothetical protein